MATTATNYGTLSFIPKRLSFSSLQRNPTPCFSLPYFYTNYINDTTNTITITSSFLLHRKPLVHITNAIGNDGGDDQELRKGAEVLVEALERQGVTHVFSYPAVRSMWDIRDADRRRSTQLNILFVDRQGVFAADSYARASNSTGVCLLGTFNRDVIKVLTNALLDGIPIVIIYNSELQEEEDFNPLRISTNVTVLDPPQQLFKEEIVRVTKQDYHVLDAADIPRIVRDAFYLAQSGHPGPVSIDIPQDVQIQLVRVLPKWKDLPPPPPPPPLCLSTDYDELYNNIVRIVSQSKKPVLYVGGGCLKNSTDELKRFVEHTGIPAIAATTATTTLVEICLDHDELFLGMPGTVSADYAADHSDLLLAIGVVRMDDPKIEAFVSRCGGEIVHIDNNRLANDVGSKIKQPITSMCVDIKLALKAINRLFESTPRFSFSAWKEELNNVNPMRLIETSFGQEAISPQYAIQVLNDLTKGRAIITTGAGKYQTWAAQCYNYRGLWITTSSTDFGLTAAPAAAVAAPVTKKSELRKAIGKMLESPGVYLLDVIVPLEEELLAAILPSVYPKGGNSFSQLEFEGDFVKTPPKHVDICIYPTKIKNLYRPYPVNDSVYVPFAEFDVAYFNQHNLTWMKQLILSSQTALFFFPDSAMNFLLQNLQLLQISCSTIYVSKGDGPMISLMALFFIFLM